MFFGISNQPKRRGPPVVKKQVQPMNFSGVLGRTNMANPGFNKKKKGSMNKGDWDRDGVGNMRDCRPFNFMKQDEEDVKGLSDKTTTPIADYPENYDYVGKDKMMKPDDFLSEAQKGYTDEKSRTWSPKEHRKNVEAPSSTKSIKKGLKERKGKVPKPYLEYNDGRIEHEGRHRAWAARDLNVKEIPVRVVRKMTPVESETRKLDKAINEGAPAWKIQMHQRNISELSA